MNFLKKWVFRLLLFIVFIVALLAASDNSQEVPLTFLDYQTPAWPVSWWMLLAFVVGVGFGLMLNLVSNARLRMDARKANQAVAKTGKELDKARAGDSLPIS